MFALLMLCSTVRQHSPTRHSVSQVAQASPQPCNSVNQYGPTMPTAANQQQGELGYLAKNARITVPGVMLCARCRSLQP